MERYNILSPLEVAPLVGQAGVRVVDLSSASNYRTAHLPHGVPLEYSQIICSRPPATGFTPSLEQIEAALGRIGLKNEDTIIAYDDEGGGKASRLLWTLDVIGHVGQTALLNGGVTAWRNTGLPVEPNNGTANLARYRGSLNTIAITDKDQILAKLGDPRVVLLDCRSPAEFSGITQRAARVGHIPGAVNIDWLRTMDIENGRQILPRDRLATLFAREGVTPDKEIIVYCHSHHRSAHTYYLLRWLGYRHVKAYPGSWSEWGNLTDLPIEREPNPRGKNFTDSDTHDAR